MARRDGDSLGKRMKRYASVSAAAVGVGARVAADNARGRTGNAERARLLGAALGGLKGPLMKVAQILAAIPDLVPPEYAAEFAKLQADAPPMGWPFVRRRMAAELGADWQAKFREFGREAAAAASLGQVHRAVGHDGRELCCKLQYPDMASVVEADLLQLKFALRIFERFDRGVDTAEVHAEISARLREELDYVREAKHMRLYRRMLSGVDGVSVPETVAELSTPRLITMEWLEGERLAQAAESRSLAARNAIAVNLFHAWYAPFYGHGVIHGDPHPGNYTVRPDNGINLLDFGCVRVFRPELVQGVITLYRALLSGDAAMAAEAYRAWGFVNPSKELVDALNIWARFIYAPLLDDRKRTVEETNTGAAGRKTARRVHEELRKAGGITVPREFVFMDRAAVGLGAVFLRLRAEVNWHRMFNELIEGFDLAAIKKNQREALRDCGLRGEI